MSFARRLWFLHGRLAISVLFGVAVYISTISFPSRTTTRILVGWDGGALLYLVFLFRLFAHSGVDKIRQRAAIYDERSGVILVLTTAAALASLAAVFAELGHAPNAEGVNVWSDAFMGTLTIILSWSFMHTIFAVHYAHEYYGEGRDREIGGLTFPGDDDPDYWDFLYYSLVIAMTAQVSDVQITSKIIRWQTTVHAIVAFFFNVAILALTVNITSNLLQGAR
jgi:uncharacterized membrane protein